LLHGRLIGEIKRDETVRRAVRNAIVNDFQRDGKAERGSGRCGIISTGKGKNGYVEALCRKIGFRLCLI